MGQEEKYDILNVLEFTSSRKRMGVVVRCPDGKLKLYIKGADTVIFPRLSTNSNKHLSDKTIEHLIDFANLGLRTLCMAMCVLTKQEYDEWEPGFHQASLALEKREVLIEREAEKIEKNLILLGASAIEDRLQNGVKATIAHLIEGGIAIWVLTGDKLETAQSIGYSCGLIDQDMPILLLSENTAEETGNKIKVYIHDFSRRKIKISLIVGGESLTHALQKRNKMRFLHLTSLCATVICCRCSPAQKASVVKLLKRWTDGTILAIGDGANDVADIGVGISGEEGMQASLAADYSIAQFQMSWIALGGSVAMLFIFFFAYCLTSPASLIIKVESAMANTIFHVLTSPIAIAYMVFVVLVSLSFDLLIKVLQRSLYRSIRDEVVSQEFDVKQFSDLYYPLVKVKKIVAKASESALSLVNIQPKLRGYSFSQDEGPAVCDVVRLYDSRVPKTPGNSARTELAHSFRAVRDKFKEDTPQTLYSLTGSTSDLSEATDISNSDHADRF
ncbi:unnamed protein product [Thelazia callipaeda]|uniref:P-type phospholipid transporter n=1 Tax=Thelazia callipaeda TaxID=103827 RepID=A0A158RCV8_THECL|nr:unnamed protein product [Thelazia callipaeda]